MDTPHFFSDAVADMDGDGSYPDIFSHQQLDLSSYTNSPKLAVDPMLLAPSLPAQPSNLADTVVIPAGQDSADNVQTAAASVSTRRSDRIAPATKVVPPKLVQNSSNDSTTTQESRPMTISDASSRKSKSTSAASTPPPEAPAPRKRKSRKVETSAKTAEKKDGKKDKLLERNRIAASKCRQRKKEYVSDLEETKTRLETQHSQLQLEYHTLLDEVTRMKTDVMAHAACNDPNIDRWIGTEARRFVQRVNENCMAQQNMVFNEPPEVKRPSTAPSPYTSRRDSISQENPATRRGSMAFSHIGEGDAFWEDDLSDLPFLASSVEMSPVDAKFPVPSSPQIKEEHAMNYDHMPDSMFSSPRESGTTA